MFGVDNGYVDGNHHHSKSSFYYDEKGDTAVKPFKVGDDFEVSGNFRKTVLTDQFMHVGNVQMERLLKSFQSKGVAVFNCSDGCKITYTHPLRSEDILFNDDKPINKVDAINYVKSKKFLDFDLKDDLEKLLCIDEFGDFCRTMAEILRQPTKDRKAAQAVLLESLRYLYSFKNIASHVGLYLLLEGEALYVSTILISLLYNYGDEVEIMPYYQAALEEWCVFLDKAPAFYEEYVYVYR
ncbi:hypothetical protein [Pseudoalteromonas xiamenensis]